MSIPRLHETIMVLIDGTTQPAICTDVFDGGWCWYLDAAFPKSFRHRFSAAEQCPLLGQGGKFVADYVSCPTDERWKVRFLISK